MKDLKVYEVEPLDLTQRMYVGEKYFLKKRMIKACLEFINKRHIP